MELIAESEKLELQINVRKNKIVAIVKQVRPQPKLEIQGKEIEMVETSW